MKGREISETIDTSKEHVAYTRISYSFQSSQQDVQYNHWPLMEESDLADVRILFEVMILAVLSSDPADVCCGLDRIIK